MSTGLLPPRANPRLEGHGPAERAFLDAFHGGRMAHAWLISGPKGVGKATFAFRAARYVLAWREAATGLFGAPPVPDSLALSAEHPVFRRVMAASHADLMVVERAYDEKRGRLRGEIVVEDVRDVGSFLNLTPAEGGWRVVVVDAADEMNTNAANAILKVLEEPPARSLLLLVAHNPGRLLPTIRSRCRSLPLRPLADDVVAELLREAQPGLDVESRSVLVTLAGGSIGRALTLAEEGGLEVFRGVAALLKSLPRLDVPAAHAFADGLGRAAADERYRIAVDVLGWWLAAIVKAAAGAADASRGGDGELIARLARTGGLDRWLQVWEKTTSLLARAESANLDRKHVILDVFSMLEDAARS